MSSYLVRVQLCDLVAHDADPSQTFNFFQPDLPLGKNSKTFPSCQAVVAIICLSFLPLNSE